MTSPENCLSPVNISSTDQSIKECNIYCTYYYDYNDSSCVVSRNKNDASGNYLDIKYDSKNSGTTPQVVFNGKNYNVSSIRVYQPSLHRYDGQQVPVELLIFHDGPTDSQGNTIKLIVSIPYQSGNASTNYISSKPGSQVLQNIITDYYKLSPSSSSSSTPQNLNIQNFNLSNFIPNAQYYYYVGPELPKYGVCSKTNTTNYILFDLSKDGQYISSDAITKLQGLIDSSKFPIKQNTLYKSAKFPNSNSAAAKSGEIYIDCNPTGSEGEELYTPPNDSQKNISSIQKLLDNITTSAIFIFILSIIGAIVVLIIVRKTFFKNNISGYAFVPNKLNNN
jgi:carbonic anhydrase